MEPENGPLEKEIPIFETNHFQVPCWNLGGVSSTFLLLNHCWFGTIWGSLGHCSQPTLGPEKFSETRPFVGFAMRWMGKAFPSFVRQGGTFFFFLRTWLVKKTSSFGKGLKLFYRWLIYMFKNGVQRKIPHHTPIFLKEKGPNLIWLTLFTQ